MARVRLALVVSLALLAIAGGGCGGSDDPSEERIARERKDAAAQALKKERVRRLEQDRDQSRAATRFEGFVTDVKPDATRADAKSSFAGGNVLLQFVFHDRAGSRTPYRVCHRSDLGRSCREATSEVRGVASIFPPLLANTDAGGDHSVEWSVRGRVVARATYTVTVEAASPEAGREQDQESPTTAPLRVTTQTARPSAPKRVYTTCKCRVLRGLPVRVVRRQSRLSAPILSGTRQRQGSPTTSRAVRLPAATPPPELSQGSRARATSQERSSGCTEGHDLCSAHGNGLVRRRSSNHMVKGAEC